MHAPPLTPISQLNTLNVSTTASSIERELNKLRENTTYPIAYLPQLQEYLNTLISEFMRFPISKSERPRYDSLFGTLSSMVVLLTYKRDYPKLSTKIDKIIREGLNSS